MSSCVNALAADVKGSSDQNVVASEADEAGVAVSSRSSGGCQFECANHVSCDEQKDGGEDGGGNGNYDDDDDDEEEGSEDGYEDEDEDVDFNPLLQETASPEASSSLSSEVECLDDDAPDIGQNGFAAVGSESQMKQPNMLQDVYIKDKEHAATDELSRTAATRTECRKGLEQTSSEELQDKILPPINHPESGISCDKNGSGSSTDVSCGPMGGGEFSGATETRKPFVNMDNDDAICKRTRAHYSLANFTLDELETFLQETDDDDDLQNVDDEEEYRKFLAAVLHGGDSNSQSVLENDNIDDEDEDHDADFVLELDEALDSDLDENTRDDIVEPPHEPASRRPKTRRNRQRQVLGENDKNIVGQLRPLRPLLPYIPIVPFRAPDSRSSISTSSPHRVNTLGEGFVNGFTPYQIGQLHCLIHEHMQLLIQVFSLCILDPARQHVASNVQKLISAMLCKRTEVLECRKSPYPSFCFSPPYIQSSVPEGGHYLPNEQVDQFRTQEGFSWAPYVSGSLVSVLDVAPLRLVGNFIDDVSSAVQEYRRRQVGTTSDSFYERQPLFPLHAIHSEGLGETNNPVSDSPVSSVFSQLPKRTMAAALVERAKKQSIAPVPREIARLAQRFYPLFNPALYPHKPPPAPVANRVLFTDSEDELLAMGLMEYNTDWKAIQQRFLPCKSKHQIFVRQKNRSSSKAPENPIKAVRRMKSSPLTAEEIKRIEEGLKIYKLDWVSIWKFILPYRDPSLLPRQWRIATGTQKSYKSDAIKKEKRRIYESQRRMAKVAATTSWRAPPEINEHEIDNTLDENNSGLEKYVGGNHAEREDEAYVHEAFLADWRPGTSSISSEYPFTNQADKTPHPLGKGGYQVAKQTNNSGPGANQVQTFLGSPANFSSQPYSQPYHAHRSNKGHLVKLSPDLPPVNLPPSARVLPQSGFQSYLGGTYSKFFPGDASVPGHAAENVSKVASPGVTYPLNPGQSNSSMANFSSNQHPQDPKVSQDKPAPEGKDGAELQLHPLLFQAPKDGHLPYYALDNSTGSSSFNFLSASRAQLNPSLSLDPRQASSTVKFPDLSGRPQETALPSLGVGFHPLLQKINISDSAVANSPGHFSTNNSASAEETCARNHNHFSGSLAESRIDPIVSCPRTSSANVKPIDIDLDIHLSCSSKRQKVIRSSSMTEHSVTRSVVNDSDSRIFESQHVESSYNCAPIAPTLDVTNSKLASRNIEPNVPGHEENTSSIDDVTDQTFPEIIMEREELSDSEDELGENVEFECEEIADSEGEDISDPDQMVNMGSKEMMDRVEDDADISDQYVPKTCDSSQNNCSREINLGLPNECINKQSKALCFNLNSRPPDSPPLEKLTEPGPTSHSVGKSKLPVRSKRIKNVTADTNHTRIRRQSVDLGSAASSSSRQKKRACAADSASRINSRSGQG